MIRALSLLAIACGALATAAFASSGHDHAGAPFTVQVDPDLVSKPTHLQTGIGRVHQKVSTESKEAQAFYDQGLAHLHSYRWIEAARSFHQALRLDPELAMAHLGLARAYEGLKDETAADRELARAQDLLEHAGPREKAYIAAYEKKREALRAGSDLREHTFEAYKKAVAALVDADDKDAEAWLLLGNAQEGGPWGRGQLGTEASLFYYDSALRAVPGHFAAHHYLAHTYENIDRPADAVKHAELYAKACPNVPHARHMYAHTLPRVGRWKEAIVELEAADELEESFAREEGLQPSDDWHHVHNLTLLGLAYLRTGRIDDAEKTLRKAFDTPIPDPLAQSWHSTWPEFLLVRGRPKEAQRAAQKLAAQDSSLLQAIGLALEGEALLDQGDAAGAAAASAEARKRILSLVKEVETHPRGDALIFVAREYANVLDTRRALVTGSDPRWVAFANRLGDSIASDPTFDGWGVGWLRLQRLQRDASAKHHDEIANRLQKHLDRFSAPPDAK